MTDSARTQRSKLPVGSYGHLASGWYGMWALVTTEAALFGYLLFSYYYVLFRNEAPWPPDGPPSLKLSVPSTILLLSSSLVAWFAERSVKRGRTGLSAGMLWLTTAMGAVFMVIQVKEWHDKSFGFADHAYSSLYFTITGFHMAHVGAGLIILASLAVWSGLGYFTKERHVLVSIGAIYWHFVDVVWIFVFTTFYVTPYLLR